MNVYYSSPYKSAWTVLLRPEKARLSPTVHFWYRLGCWFVCTTHPSLLWHADQSSSRNQVAKKVKANQQKQTNTFNANKTGQILILVPLLFAACGWISVSLSGCLWKPGAMHRVDFIRKVCNCTVRTVSMCTYYLWVFLYFKPESSK